MIVFNEFAEAQGGIDKVLCLPFEKRQKSRLRTRLVSGEEVGVNLPRGSVLRSGDCLRSDDGSVVRVQAEAEQTSRLISDNPLLLLRAAYHLGNRHVPLEVSASGLRYLYDHVLDEMVQQLGLTVQHETAPFEPESGAYAGSHHTHD